jgi:hypothetical protein
MVILLAESAHRRARSAWDTNHQQVAIFGKYSATSL